MRDSEITTSSRKRLAPLLRRGLVFLVWGGSLTAGFALLLQYENEPGRDIARQQGAGKQFVDSEKLSLVMAVHPRCPCTRASVDELCRIYSREPGKFKVTALVYKPSGERCTWTESGSLAALQKLQPRIVADVDGAIAESMGMGTSGQVQLFSSTGEMLYNGGITGSRGHRGDNAGEATVLDLIRGVRVERKSMPVYGCPIIEELKEK